MSPTLEVPTPHGHHPHVSNRLRTGMRKLLPFGKTATFLVRVTIHEVTNVPLVSGRFSVRWKFRGGRGGDVTEKNHAASTDNLQQNTTLTRTSTDDTLAATPRSHPSPKSSTSSSFYHSSSISSSTVTPHSGDTLHSPHGNSQLSNPHSSPNPHSNFASSPLAPQSARLNKASMENSMTSSTQSSTSTRSADSSTSPLGLYMGTSLQRTESPDRISNLSAPSLSDVDTDGTRSGLESGMTSANASSIDLSSIDVSGRGRLNNLKTNGDKPSRSNSLSNLWKAKHKTGERSDSSGPHGSKAGELVVKHGDVDRRGHTPVQDLHEHACSWDYELVQTVRMEIHPIPHTDHSSSFTNLSDQAKAHARSLGRLGAGPKSESGLKLTILQNVDIGKPHHHHHNNHHKDSEPLQAAQHFGVVNLNLAEYACDEARMGRGGITRRYLLKEGKTNATIRLTIELEHIGGEKEYHTPPFQKGQVVAGLAAFSGLGQNEPLLAPIPGRRKRPGSSASSSSVGTTMAGLTHSASTSSHSLAEKRSIRSLRTGKGAERPEMQAGHSFAGSTADTDLPHAHNPHHYHTHRSRHRHRHHNAPALSTEEVIHGVFNPRPSKDVGPFYKPLDSGIVLAPYQDDPEDDEDGGLQIPIGGKGKERRPVNGRLWTTLRHPKGGGHAGAETPRSGTWAGGTPLGEKRFNWHPAQPPDKGKRHSAGSRPDS